MGNTINGFELPYADDRTDQNKFKTWLKIGAETFISTVLTAISVSSSLAWLRSGTLTTLIIPALVVTAWLLSMAVLFHDYLQYKEREAVK